MRIAEKISSKILFKTDWLSIRRTKGWYDYLHQEKSDGKAVAVLIYRNHQTKQIYGRFEEVPCHFDGINLCALTGMVEKGDDFNDTAVKEIYEEAGIKCSVDDLIFLGSIRNSKASDTITHLYALDASGKYIGEPIGDGTEGEKEAYCKWVSFSDAVMCKDPLMAALIKRAEVNGINIKE